MPVRMLSSHLTVRCFHNEYSEYRGNIPYSNTKSLENRAQLLWKSASFISTYRCNTQAYLFTYLLSPWSRVILEKLIDSQLVTKFPAFDGTRKFITAHTSARHLFLNWAISIQSMPLPTSLRPILILSSHLRQGHPSVLFHLGSLPKPCMQFSPHTCYMRNT